MQLKWNAGVGSCMCKCVIRLVLDFAYFEYNYKRTNTLANRIDDFSLTISHGVHHIVNFRKVRLEFDEVRIRHLRRVHSLPSIVIHNIEA